MEKPAMTNTTATPIAAALLALLAGCDTVETTQQKDWAVPIKGFPAASLTIFPVTLTIAGPVDRTPHHRAFADAYARGFREKGPHFANTLGLLLAEKGYGEPQLASTEFHFPSEKTARKARAAAFGKFVGGLGLKTDYALCTEFTLRMGTGGFHEVYSVIADANGSVVWEDSQSRGDPEYEKHRPKTELYGLELACRRLTPAMGLGELPRKELSKDKKRALRELRAKEPPRGAEFAAMEKRLKAMKDAGAGAGVLICPARVGGDHTDPNSATRLSGLLNEAKLCHASAAEAGPVMEGTGWPNEMQVLWLFARAVREYVREHPAESGYVLFPDYWFAPNGRVWAVHFVVCDRAGDWVIVDLQNSHREDFQRVAPRTLADCDRLVLERLKRELR
jgi:hypothetical protein